MSTQTTDVSSLVEELKKPTEAETSKETSGSDAYKFERPSGDDPDFDPEPKPETTSSTESSPAPAMTQSAARRQAERYTKMFGALVKWGGKPLYRWSMLKKGDVQKVADFQHKASADPDGGRRMVDQVLNDAGHEMHAVMMRFDAYMKAVEDLPLSDDECETIADPLTDLIIKYQYLQLGPEMMFVIAVVLVMAPRFAVMIPGVGKIVDTAKRKASED